MLKGFLTNAPAIPAPIGGAAPAPMPVAVQAAAVAPIQPVYALAPQPVHVQPQYVPEPVVHAAGPPAAAPAAPPAAEKSGFDAFDHFDTPLSNAPLPSIAAASTPAVVPVVSAPATAAPFSMHVPEPAAAVVPAPLPVPVSVPAFAPQPVAAVYPAPVYAAAPQQQYQYPPQQPQAAPLSAAGAGGHLSYTEQDEVSVKHTHKSPLYLASFPLYVTHHLSLFSCSPFVHAHSMI